MNPLTLDFIRRWKGLLLVQFVITAGAWIMHAKVPQSRLHLVVIVAVAMSWDLMRGLVRAQLGLPQRRASIAAGLWYSVVGAGVAVHLAAMMLGGVVLAPLLGQAVDAGVLGLHAVFCVLLIGTVQFILTGLPSAPPRTLAGQVKGAIFGGLWGLPMFGIFWLCFFAPASWEQVTMGQRWIMLVMGALTVASWFTTRSMMLERAMPKLEAVPPRPAVDHRSGLHGTTGWAVRLEQEMRWLMPVVFMVLMAAGIMIAINDFSGRGATSGAQGMNQYRSMAMLNVMIGSPLVMVAAGSLRALRSLPLRLSSCALLVALRPFVASVAMMVVFMALNAVIGRSSGMEGQALIAFLPLCSLMSLTQAVMIRYPRFPVAMGLMMVVAMISVIFVDWLPFSLPGLRLLVSGVLLLLSWGLHWRWLSRSSRIYRLNGGFLRMMGGAAR
ncbi:MAG: hypothetical protein V4675_12185 [Verrucomicrobiota bacterium]